VLPSVKSTSCGRVLISSENLKLLEVKKSRNKEKGEAKRRAEDAKRTEVCKELAEEN